MAVVTPAPAAFMSYARFDDQHDDGWLTRLREQLSAEVRALTGRDFAIFQDRSDIAWGQNWQQRIDEALDTVTLLLVIITPSLFSSSACRAEVNKFLDRERDLGRQDMILPVYYISAREMDDAALRETDDLAKVLASRQVADLRELRGERISSPRMRRIIEQLAIRMRDHVTAHGRQQEGARAIPGGDVGEGVAAKIDGRVTGVGNVSLYWQGWLPKGRVTGVVLLCHGACEHSGRYHKVVNALAPDNWAVYGVDHRGHGQSGDSAGKRVHVERFSDWVGDFDIFRRKVTARHRDLPVFVLGHSLGGQIALGYALDHQQDLRGLVLSAPYLTTTVNPVVQQVGRIVRPFAPTTRPHLVDLDKISQDHKVVEDYKLDPYVFHDNPTLKMGDVIRSQFDVLIERSHDLRIPLLIQHGTEDKIADPKGSQRLAEACGSPDTDLRLYPGFWHEIYNEPEGQKPLDDLRGWLAKHR